MSLDLLAVHDQITAKLKELPQDVYEIDVPADDKIQFGGNKLFLPYIVVTYGDMIESGSRGIVSVRENLGVSYALIQATAPTQRAARQVANAVRELLTGFQPTDAGELRLEGGRHYTVQANNTVPKRYVAEVAYTFVVNTVVS